MKSKIALEDLKDRIKTYVCNFETAETPIDFDKWFYKKRFEIIQKDLEVLKILRKLFKKDLFIYQREKIDKKFTCRQIYHIAKTSNGDDLLFNNQQDILKIKEWLENDN